MKTPEFKKALVSQKRAIIDRIIAAMVSKGISEAELCDRLTMSPKKLQGVFNESYDIALSEIVQIEMALEEKII